MKFFIKFDSDFTKIREELGITFKLGRERRNVRAH